MALIITPRTDYLPRLLRRYSCLGSQGSAGAWWGTSVLRLDKEPE